MISSNSLPTASSPFLLEEVSSNHFQVLSTELKGWAKTAAELIQTQQSLDKNNLQNCKVMSLSCATDLRLSGENPKFVVWAARGLDGKVRSVVVLLYREDLQIVEIDSLVTHPCFFKKGAARFLLSALVEKFSSDKEVKIITVSPFRKVEKFYEKFGFVKGPPSECTMLLTLNKVRDFAAA